MMDQYIKTTLILSEDNMKLPRMIIFDYGQTLLNEISFDPLYGTEEVLKHATYNPKSVSAQEIQSLANTLHQELGRNDESSKYANQFEVHNHIFQRYLYEYFGVQFTKSSMEIERIFTETSFEIVPTQNIVKLLEILEAKGIRTAVISNISLSGKMLSELIDKYLPSHNFEFIIASSEYIFKKPNKRIFELALRKASLQAHEVWYCGDHAVYDIEGSSALGLKPIWYKGAIKESNNYIPNCNYTEIEDWNELIDIIHLTLEA